MTEHDDQPRDPALSHRYREANEAAALTPPPALDARILAAARAAVQPPPRPVRPWWQRLTLPVGIAATTLLAVMLSLMVQRQTPETLEHAPTGNTAPAAAPAPRAPEAPPVAAPAAAPTDSVPSRAERAPQTAEKKTVSPPAAPAALPAAGASPAAMPAPAASHDAAGVSARLKAETAADRAPLQKAAPAAAPSRLDAAKGTVVMPAEAWIEEIRELRRLGRAEDAARLLAEFRQAYPEYVLPADLR